MVPSDIDHDFEAKVVLTHPFTKFEKVIDVKFVYS